MNSTGNQNFDYDLLVIGGGSGGLAAAKRAASYGAKVAIAEQNALGGTCVNRGCIAKKLMVYAADFAHHYQEATSYGWSTPQTQFDWLKFKAAMDGQVEHLNQSAGQALKEAGIELFHEHATLRDAHTVDVGHQVTADKILLAVGGKPTLPDIPGIEHALTSDDMFQLQQLPKHLAVIGGGYIGIEFSSIMHGLGCKVTLMDTSEMILSGFDPDVRKAVQQGLTKRGIQILNETTAKSIERVSNNLQLTLSGNCPETITADTLLCAVGRKPKLEGFGLENAGVETKDGAIAVDGYSRTSQTNIFAVGDCTDRMALTPVARAEGQAFADTEFGGHSRQVDYQWVPSAVCARPEAATVGLSEEKAREKLGDAVECYRTQFPSLFQSLPKAEETLIKLVVDRNSDQVLGAHMVGGHAAEIIQTLAVAIQAGTTRKVLHDTIGIHPTSSEEFYSL